MDRLSLVQLRRVFVTLAMCLTLGGMSWLLPSALADTPGTLTSVTVTPTDPTITVGQTQPFTAAGTFSDGATRSLTASPGVWATTGSMAVARSGHSATLLPSGKVLVVGGHSSSGTVALAELYDPSSGSWSPAGSLATGRHIHTATLLSNGKVLVAGGLRQPGNVLLNSTEIYDPASNTWTAGPPFALGGRADHSAVLLGNGKVLVAVGLQSYPDCTNRSNAELYDPASNTWTPTGSLSLARQAASTTLLSNGKVLLAGGPVNGCPYPNPGLGEAELYDPVTGSWTVTGSLVITRYNNAMTLLQNGKVLLAGGYTGSIPTATAELYDPATGTFSPTGAMAEARGGITSPTLLATLLPSGKVLVVGGVSSSGVLGSVELYDPSSGTWSPAGSMMTPRTAHAVVLLQNGQVLAVGGDTISGGFLSSAELYTPSDELTWASSNTAVATINASGLSTGASPGASTITATSGGISGTAILTVVSPDAIAPTTVAGASPSPNGAGWNNANVTVALNALDDPGGSGVQSITYTLTGAQAGGGVATASNTSFTITAEGATTVTFYARDNAGNVESGKSLVIKIDKTGPVLSMPANMTVNATSPAGAAVTFAPTATDATSGVATVTSSPASGSTFATGTTTVTVTATDNAGNTSTETFTVTVVQGPAAQIQALTALVQSFNLQQGLENSLDAKLQNALDALNSAIAGNIASACNKLSAFMNEVQAQSGKKLTAAQASQLIAAASQIKASVGCP